MFASKPLVAEFGITRFFGLGDIAGRNLASGWAVPEEKHNWNDGLEASLTLTISETPTAPCVLSIEARPHLAPGLDHQDVTFYFNGYRIGFWRLNHLSGVILEAEIEPEFWLTRGSGAFARCNWHLPDSVIPSEVTSIRDDRQLGLCFQSMTLTRPRR